MPLESRRISTAVIFPPCFFAAEMLIQIFRIAVIEIYPVGIKHKVVAHRAALYYIRAVWRAGYYLRPVAEAIIMDIIIKPIPAAERRKHGQIGYYIDQIKRQISTFPFTAMFSRYASPVALSVAVSACTQAQFGKYQS